MGKIDRNGFNASRSADYRRRFLEANPGPWRCQYCNRRIEREDRMTVDHVVPVAAAGSRGLRGIAWRRVLADRGITDVNDLRNLVPACPRCNSRKGQKTGLWVARAALGRHRAWWAVRNVTRACLVAGCLALAWWVMQGGLGDAGRHVPGILRRVARALLSLA